MPAQFTHRLHSIYNPVLEAQRFVDANAHDDLHPVYLVVTEPGESWLVPILRQRFPDVRLVAIRYTADHFIDTDALWDFVWRPNTGINIVSFLYTIISEDDIQDTVFWSWKPSDLVWAEMSITIWASIKDFLKLQSSVISTRQAFGPVWLYNTFRNALYADRPVQISLPDKPTLITAAGPSLESLFPLVAEKFFMLSVSSSNACVLQNNVVPDLCMVTDAGYWVTQHFRNFPWHIPVALPLEACLPRQILKTNQVVFLDYGSVVEKEILGLLGYTGISAVRNGSVSGTAALFALAHTDTAVFISGLDLSATTAFTHARPHPSLTGLDETSTRIQPLCSQLVQRNLYSSSMEIYRNWFARQNSSFKSRFFQIKPVERPIPGISSCTIERASELADSSTSYLDTSGVFARPIQCLSFSERKHLLLEWITKLEKRVLDDIFLAEKSVIASSSVEMEIVSMAGYSEYLRFVRTNRMKTDTSSAAHTREALIRKVESCTNRIKNRLLYD